MQAKHVKEELDNNYEKNNWLKPIGVASSCLFALIIVLSIAAPNQGNSARLDARIDAAAKEENVAQAKAAEKAKKETTNVISKYVLLGNAPFCVNLGAFKAYWIHTFNSNIDGMRALIRSAQCGIISGDETFPVANNYQLVEISLDSGDPYPAVKIKYPTGVIFWVMRANTTI